MIGRRIGEHVDDEPDPPETAAAAAVPDDTATPIEPAAPASRDVAAPAEVAAPAAVAPVAAAPVKPAREVIYRHSLIVRLTHWVNVLVISLLLMSGAQIFNAHPSLYWGQYGADADKPILAMGAANGPHGLVGITQSAG